MLKAIRTTEGVQDHCVQCTFIFIHVYNVLHIYIDLYIYRLVLTTGNINHNVHKNTHLIQSSISNKHQFLHTITPHIPYYLYGSLLLYYLMQYADFNGNYAQLYVFRTDVMASKNAGTVCFS